MLQMSEALNLWVPQQAGGLVGDGSEDGGGTLLIVSTEWTEMCIHSPAQAHAELQFKELFVNTNFKEVLTASNFFF